MLREKTVAWLDVAVYDVVLIEPRERREQRMKVEFDVFDGKSEVVLFEALMREIGEH